MGYIMYLIVLFELLHKYELYHHTFKPWAEFKTRQLYAHTHPSGSLRSSIFPHPALKCCQRYESRYENSCNRRFCCMSRSIAYTCELLKTKMIIQSLFSTSIVNTRIIQKGDSFYRAMYKNNWLKWTFFVHNLHF